MGEVTGLVPPPANSARPDRPEILRRAFENGEFPYATKLTEREYQQRVMHLQVELLKAQCLRTVPKSTANAAPSANERHCAARAG